MISIFLTLLTSSTVAVAFYDYLVPVFPSSITLVEPIIMTLKSSFILIYVLASHLRTIVTMDGSIVLLMLLTLFDFYFVPDDRASYIDSDSMYIFTLHTDDNTPTHNNFLYEDNSYFNFDTLS